MVGRGEFMDVHEAWVRGKSITEIARLTGRDPQDHPTDTARGRPQAKGAAGT
jgi:hypothetical protein